MRIVINGGGLLIILMLTILIHCSIISHTLRDSEISTGLESATDYAIDELMDMYKIIDYEENKEEQYANALIERFCVSLEKMIVTDGNITVSVITADIKNGTFDIVVQEDYDYGIFGRKGKVVCERAVCFGT